MRAVWTITGKDLRQRLRDRSVLMIAFVVPLGLAFVFNLLFGGLQEGLGDVRMGVADLDDARVGQAFTDQYLPGVAQVLETEETSLEVVELDSAEEARERVTDGEVQAAVVVPEEATARLRSAQSVSFEVVTKADESLAGRVVTSLTEQFVQQARGQLAARVLAERAQLPDEQAEQLANTLAGVQGRIRLDQSLPSNETMGLSTYLVAGMAIFFLFFTVQFGVLGYLEERRDGTLPRLLAAPVTRAQVLGAKSIVSLVVGIASTGALMLVAVPVLGASWGAPLPAVLLVVAAVLAATSLVAAVGAVARTAEQANVWQSVIAVVLGMLGGSFFPIADGSGLLAKLTLLTPHAWFMRGLQDVRAGGGVPDVLPAVGAMLAFGVVVGVVGLLLSRREVAL